jgi:hypothetical protein
MQNGLSSHLVQQDTSTGKFGEKVCCGAAAAGVGLGWLVGSGTDGFGAGAVLAAGGALAGLLLAGSTGTMFGSACVAPVGSLAVVQVFAVGSDVAPVWGSPGTQPSRLVHTLLGSGPL